MKYFYLSPFVCVFCILAFFCSIVLLFLGSFLAGVVVGWLSFVLMTIDGELMYDEDQADLDEIRRKMRE